MKPIEIINIVKDTFLSHQFELCEEYIDDESLSISFIKKDCRIDVSFSEDDQSFNLSLDRPFYDLRDSKTIQQMRDVTDTIESFVSKINSLIKDDESLPRITKDDCELFLKTSSYDGMSSGVIEYQGSLFYIQSITNPYLKDKSKEDSNNRVWRHFYVHPMTKEELEKVVMTSLDWMRHINLTSLCKDWNSLRLDTSANDSEHKKHFDGKYRFAMNPSLKPTMKLTLFY